MWMSSKEKSAFWADKAKPIGLTLTALLGDFCSLTS
jgi:hypothetical protein